MPGSTPLPRRAKIICTLGPSSNTYDKIKALVQAGMDVARLNFSHGTHDDHRKIIKIIRHVSKEIGKPIAIMQDLQGPKIRIKTFSAESVHLNPGDNFTLTTRNVSGNKNIVSVSYPSFAKDVSKGDTILLDDGLIHLKAEKIADKDIICRVIFGGTLSDHKGINLPGNILSVTALTSKDKADLDFGIKMGVDYVALSFVQKPEDIIATKKIISKSNKNIPVVAKIEKPQAVESIDKITDIADVVMVARGDLGVELSPEEVPPAQKKIIALCNMKGIPVITATQMLESMIHNPRPTRAEASDVANAVLDGSDAVMLSGETANGKFPIASVQTMHRIVLLTEKKIPPKNWNLRRRRPDVIYDTSSTIGYCACQAADLCKAAAIVCLTETGSTARMIARYRPEQRLIAITHSESSLRRMSLIWGVIPHSVHEFGDNMDKAVAEIMATISKSGNFNKGDKIILTAGVPFQSKPGTNMLRIEEITT